LVLLGCGAILVLMLLVAGTVGALWALGVFGKAGSTTARQTDSQSGKDSGLKPATEKPRDRLVGQWEYMPPDVPGAKMTLDVRKDGTLTLAAINKGNSATENGTWEVLSEKSDRLTIRLQFVGRPKASEWDIELLPNDEMRVNFLTSSSPPVTYKRKR
jgi:hypothetical protein